MQIRVEIYVDKDGVVKLRRFRFDSRVIEVAENIDQWHGTDYRYFKVRASDGSVCILRHNEIRDDWVLTMYQQSRCVQVADRDRLREGLRKAGLPE